LDRNIFGVERAPQKNKRMASKAAILTALVVTGVVASGLLWLNMLRTTQQQIDGLHPPLPTYRQIMAGSRQAGLPVAIHFLATASQKIARYRLLDRALDPNPGGNVDMTFPAFVLTWSDGQRFIVDGGLSANEAVTFGRQQQWLGGFQGQPMVYHQSLANSLDPTSIKGVGLTHLHSDHTTGLADLCAAGAHYTTYQTLEQYTQQNYLTFGGDDALAAMTCSVRLVLAEQESPLRDIQGFPGLYVVPVAGHTPGSQVFVAHVQGLAGVQTYVLAGDIANHRDGVQFNIGKPAWYNRWLVPENLAQLDRLRRWLKSLNDSHLIQVLLSHDLKALQDSDVPALESCAVCGLTQSGG